MADAAAKADLVNGIIGRPYDIRRFNCWHCAGLVLERLYGRALPKFRARDAISQKARNNAVARFDGWAEWREVDRPQDGAVLLMSRGGCTPDMHAGVFIDLGPASGVLHCDDDVGSAVFDDLLALRSRGFTTIRMLVPA